MQVRIKRDCDAPGERGASKALFVGQVYDLSNADAEALIEAGNAEAIEPKVKAVEQAPANKARSRKITK